MLAYTLKCVHAFRLCLGGLLSISPFWAVPGIAAEAQKEGPAYIFVAPGLAQSQRLAFRPEEGQTIITLQPGQPLMAQIAAALKGKTNVRALHVLSEGTPGEVHAAGTLMSQTELDAIDTQTRKTIAAALKPGADLLLYGCRIAEGPEGKAFVSKLAATLGVDVAASTNDTGHSSLGADWLLETQTGPIETQVAVTDEAQEQWQSKLALGISIASSTTTLMNALGPTGQNGLTYSGTPTILGAFSSNAYGTFSISNSNLGMQSGVVLGTGNVSQLNNAPSFFWDGAGTGSTSGNEFDRAALTFSFTPQPGVTKVVWRYVMGSEEYNEFVGQNFSDNITIRLNGGIYTNTNVALVPNTSTGIDIDTINASINSTYYRDNTVATPPVPDSALDGHTTVLRSVSSVVPGTSYTAEIKVADFTDNQYNTALFVDYFGAALLIDLDANNSTGATLADYNGNFTEAGATVPVVDSDRTITNLDTTSIQSATITLTNAFNADSLTFSGLPAGITGTTDTSVPGVIRILLTGSATIADYQTALSTIRFSNSSNVPNTTTRVITVVVNDGATNSNTATSRITVTSIPTYLYTVAKTASAATISAPGNINYTVTLVNTGDGNMTGVNVLDVVSQGVTNTNLTLTGPTGDAGTIGQFDIGETWTYTATLAATQLHIDNGNPLVNTATVTTTQTGAAQQTAQATTTVTTSPAMTILKTADTAGPLTAGQVVTYTYTVRNSGNITINNVSVADVHNGTGTPPVPSSETLTIDASPTGDSTDVTANGTWTKLAPGDTIRFTAAYNVTQSDIDLRQ